MSAFRFLRPIWHVLPESWRARAKSLSVVSFLKERIRPTEKEQHDEIYNEEYYLDVDATTSKSAPTIIKSIVRDLRPMTLLDVGCGTGALLLELQHQGIRGDGLEYSEAALVFCRRRQLSVKPFNLETDILTPPPKLYDVVMSTEVAEHLPEGLAEPFVNALVSQGKTIVFTAATPGQGGKDHVNEQPHQYWIDKFQKRGFTLDEPLSLAWRAEWKAGGAAFWYSNNVMIFRG